MSADTTKDLGLRIVGAGEVAVSAASARRRAIATTVAAVRALEKQLQQALDGEPLRGLPNLGTSTARFYGARLRGKHNAPLSRDPYESSFFLCLNQKARLVLVRLRFVSDGGIWTLDLEERPAPDAPFVLEDVEALAEVLAAILPKHVEAARAAEARYAKAARLHATLIAALGEG